MLANQRSPGSLWTHQISSPTWAGVWSGSFENVPLRFMCHLWPYDAEHIPYGLRNKARLGIVSAQGDPKASFPNA